MATVLGLNAVFHDPAAALVVDGVTVAAAEEERFSRRKHGKRAVPFSAWELPEAAMRWCLSKAGVSACELDAVAYSYDPRLLPLRAGDLRAGDLRVGDLRVGDLRADEWEPMRTLYALEAPSMVRDVLPGLDPDKVVFVGHHLAHAASAHLAAPYPDSSVLVLDGRGETASHLAGHSSDGELEVIASQQLPHSLGLMYEAVTEHLGFLRSSDEYKVMALASYGRPRWLEALREKVRTDGAGGFRVETIPWSEFVAPRHPGEKWGRAHADLASSVQVRLEEVLLELAGWLHDCTGDECLTMAGGVALNCVANSRLAAEGPFEHVWVQPAAGDSGTALGAAMFVARSLGDRVAPMGSAALGRSWGDAEIEASVLDARLPYETPRDLAGAVADILAGEGVVAWYEGASEYGPRALGHRSLLADPRRSATLSRLNDIKGREQFRPVAPMVPLERAAEIFEGPLPSPYMLFTHRVRPEWATRIPAVVHVDGSARAQTVDRDDEPLLHRLLVAFERRTGVPVLVNTSLNTAGRPMVDSPTDALECFGSAPVDALVLGRHLLRRPVGAGAYRTRSQPEMDPLGAGTGGRAGANGGS